VMFGLGCRVGVACTLQAARSLQAMHKARDSPCAP
jgi:hypothetical protein